MKVNLLHGTLLAAILFTVSACEKEQQSATEAAPVAAQQKMTGNEALLQSVRQATSRFHSTTQAKKAGYVPDTRCVSVPGVGGMGYHWVNPGLIDPVFDPLKPEVMLYAPGPDKQLRLVAVEYIVINAQQPAPRFGTQAFTVGGTPVPRPHWSLHVWMYEHNPLGMFVAMNPNISCQ